jgi:hypothetical protein
VGVLPQRGHFSGMQRRQADVEETVVGLAKIHLGPSQAQEKRRGQTISNAENTTARWETL